MTEVGGASLAAQKADEADLAAIQQAWDNLQQVIRGEGVGAQDDFAFHLAVARASKTEKGPTIFGKLNPGTGIVKLKRAP